MKVKVITEKWALEEIDGVNKIVGKYKLVCGGTTVASQNFNTQYDSTTIIFPTELIVDIEKIGLRIEEAITKNFTGGE